MIKNLCIYFSHEYKSIKNLDIVLDILGDDSWEFRDKDYWMSRGVTDDGIKYDKDLERYIVKNVGYKPAHTITFRQFIKQYHASEQ